MAYANRHKHCLKSLFAIDDDVLFRHGLTSFWFWINFLVSARILW
jgi:hypothetical protein